MRNPLQRTTPTMETLGQPVPVPESGTAVPAETAATAVAPETQPQPQPLATDAPPVRTRLANLAKAVDGGTRTRPRADMSKVLVVVGIAMIGLGIADTLLGWYGAAHSPYLYQEIPYLISGGLLGVCLTIGGGSLFVTGWIVRVMHENRRHTVVLARTLDRLERTMRANAVAQIDGQHGGSSMSAEADTRTPAHAGASQINGTGIGQ